MPTFMLVYVSKFENWGHFGPDLNFEILIHTENIESKLSLAGCFMIIAAWISFMHVYINYLAD